MTSSGPEGSHERPRGNAPNGTAHINRRRSRSPRRRSPPPQSAYRRRSPPRKRQRTRSPSPIRDSPPPERRRPGGAPPRRGRNVLADQERLAAEREKAQAQHNQNLAVQQASNNFYNARPEWVKERGRDWRRNESKIKGLRSFNNWVKSCIIQKFSPEEKQAEEELGWGEEAKEPEEQKPLLVLDIGCGKGGDLGKWQLAPQHVALYVGLDPANTSIDQATDRYQGMRRGRKSIFDARFVTKDCFGEWIGDVGIVREVGIDPNVGQGGNSKWSPAGFDVVSMMFSMHYAFESEAKVRMMLRNVAGSLKKGGRFLGVVPNSDALADSIREWYKKREGQEPVSAAEAPSAETKGHIAPSAADTSPSWGNSIYSVRFPDAALPPASELHPNVPPAEGVFRPPFAWKYTYWMDEAVDVPEFVVPWEAFRAIALDFGLEQRWRRPFLEIWDREGGDQEMNALARRMGVLKDDGRLAISEEEREAVAFYAGFCFVKV
jgi:mRNA (guanine-N7-)-methyltransferase